MKEKKCKDKLEVMSSIQSYSQTALRDECASDGVLRYSKVVWKWKVKKGKEEKLGDKERHIETVSKKVWTYELRLNSAQILPFFK